MPWGDFDYSDTGDINSLRRMGYDYTANRRAASGGFESGLGAANALVSGIRQANAFREAKREREAAKEALANMDMENPDYSKILGAAPQYGIKLMQGLNQIQTNKRLEAANRAANAATFLQMGLNTYQRFPTEAMYSGLMKGLTDAGTDPKIKNVIPTPQMAAENPEAFQKALTGFQDYAGQLKYEMVQQKGIEDRLTNMDHWAREEAIQKLRQLTEREKTQGKLDVEERKRIIKEGENKSRERVADINFQAAKVRKEPGPGKQKESAPPITLRQPGGGAGQQGYWDTVKGWVGGGTPPQAPAAPGGFNPNDLSGYQAVLRTGNPALISEAQRRMKAKYGSLPE